MGWRGRKGLDGLRRRRESGRVVLLGALRRVCNARRAEKVRFDDMVVALDVYGYLSLDRHALFGSLAGPINI